MVQSSYSVIPGFGRNISIEEAEVLRNSRRREVIKALSEEDSMLESLAVLFLEQEDPQPRPKKEVVKQVASWEEDTKVESISEDTWNTVQSTLHQHHLPKLDEYGVVEYSADEGAVDPDPVVERYAEFTGERPFPEGPFPGVKASAKGFDDSFLTADLVFDILSNERRRRALDFMQDRHRELTLSEISEYIAELESDPEERVSSGDRKTVYVGLTQCHLPRMEEADVIDYDENRKKVERGKYFYTVTRYLPDNLENTPEEGEKTRASVLSLF